MSGCGSSSIKLEKYSEKALKEYAELTASAEGKPFVGSVAALVSALAASLGSLAVNLAGSEAEARVKTAADELNQMRVYMLNTVDDDTKARAPLNRRKQKPEEKDHLESAARVACGIPSDMVFVMCRCIELLDQISDVCNAEGAVCIVTAVHLSLAVIYSMQAEIRALSKYMQDEVFVRTIIREAEMHLEQHQSMADALLEKMQKKMME